MRLFAARFRFVWLVAGLALLIVPVAQARSTATASIVGTWAGPGGAIAINVTEEGGSFVGRWASSGSCVFFDGGDNRVWLINNPGSVSNSIYIGTSIQGGGPDPDGHCWIERWEGAHWVVNGSQLAFSTDTHPTPTQWTKTSTTTTTTGTQTTKDNAVRKAVTKAFNAVSAANKKMTSCSKKWGRCRKVAYGLQRVATSWHGCFVRSFLLCKEPGASAAAKAGRRDTITALGYWIQDANAAIKTDAAVKARNATLTKYWFGICSAKFKQAVKYEKLAVKHLWPS